MIAIKDIAISTPVKTTNAIHLLEPGRVFGKANMCFARWSCWMECARNLWVAVWGIENTISLGGVRELLDTVKVNI